MPRLGYFTKPGRRKTTERSGKLSRAHTNNAERNHEKGVLDLIARYNESRDQYVQKSNNLNNEHESTTISINITIAGKEGRRNIREIEEKLSYISSALNEAEAFLMVRTTESSAKEHVHKKPFYYNSTY